MLRFDGLDIRQGSFRLTADFEVPPGVRVALVGPSGGGKTTVLLLVAGLARTQRGRVLFDERDMTGSAPRTRDVGFVFQNYALYPHLDVRGNIAYPLKFLRLGRAETQSRVIETARSVGVETLLDKPSDALSGGQKQRVALARALVKRPKILLMDEPLANVDAPKRAELRRLLRDVQRRLALTAIIATHDQQEAVALADHIACVSEGCVLQAGAPAELVERPQSIHVARFFGWPAVNELPATIENRRVRIEGMTIAEARLPDGPVLAAVRPENVRLSPEGRIGARVLDTEKVGREIVALLETPVGALRAVRPADADAPGVLAVRRQVSVDISPESVTLYTADGARRLGSGLP